MDILTDILIDVFINISKNTQMVLDQQLLIVSRVLTDSICSDQRLCLQQLVESQLTVGQDVDQVFIDCLLTEMLIKISMECKLRVFIVIVKGKGA